MKEQNDFISIPKAAKRFGVDRRTMWRWVKSNKIPSFVTPGGHHRISRSEINALLAQNRHTQNAPPKSKTILVVDDDEVVRKTFITLLTREKYAVEAASDGFKAGLKARDINPDLIVLDLMMEGVDGFELCRTIKADNSLRHTKILIMTGFDTPENRERALGEGADDFISKGNSPKRILKRIRSLLDE